MATKAAMAVQLDYLPYADTELHEFPGLRARADALVQAELARLRLATGNGDGRIDVEAVLAQHGYASSSVRHLDDIAASSSDNEFLASEMQRVLANGPAPINFADDARYSAVAAPADDAGPEAWEAALQHNRLVLERAENDVINGDLLAEFGPSAWKVYAQTMEGLRTRVEEQLGRAREQSTGINQVRKGAHIAAAQKVHRMKEKWLEHIHQVRLIDEALGEAYEPEKETDATTLAGNKRPAGEELRRDQADDDGDDGEDDEDDDDDDDDDESAKRKQKHDKESKTVKKAKRRKHSE